MNYSQRTKTQTSFWGTKTLLICLSLIALAAGVVAFFNVSISTVAFLSFALACPLMHIWMMKDGGHKH